MTDLAKEEKIYNGVLVATTSTSSADSDEFDLQSGTTIGNFQQCLGPSVHITLRTLHETSFNEDRKKTE